MSIIDVASFGANGTGGDDTSAIQAAIASAQPGDRIVFGHGRFGISQTLRPRCIVEGNDPVNCNIFVVPGSNLPTMFDMTDCSGAGVRNLGLTGEGVYIPKSQGAAIQFGGHTVTVEDVRIEGCRFDNFKADYWVLGVSGLTTQATQICRNRFITKTGDGPVYADGSPSGGGLIVLFGTSTGAFIETKVNDNIINGTGVAFGISFFGVHRYFEASRNHILSMGYATTAKQNSYGILAYGLQDHGSGEPAIGTISDNQINYPASAGIYCASSSQILITGNRIIGQSRVDNMTLPRGAIALNGPIGFTVVGNDLQDNWCGISVEGSPGTTAPADVLIASNRIRSAAGGNTMGIQMNCELPVNGRLSVTDNDVWLFSGGSTAFVNQITGSGDVVIKNNASRAYYHGLSDLSQGRTFIGGNTFFPL